MAHPMEILSSISELLAISFMDISESLRVSISLSADKWHRTCPIALKNATRHPSWWRIISVMTPELRVLFNYLILPKSKFHWFIEAGIEALLYWQIEQQLSWRHRHCHCENRWNDLTLTVECVRLIQSQILICVCPGAHRYLLRTNKPHEFINNRRW